MNEHLRDRILRRLDALPDERGYQVLDYVEFLESRYAERQAPNNAFTRFTEAVEDRLRAGKVSASAIAETMGFMNRAVGVLSSALETGRTVATDIVSTAARAGAPPPAPSPAVPSPSTITDASSPAHDVKAPGTGQEKL